MNRQSTTTTAEIERQIKALENYKSELQEISLMVRQVVSKVEAGMSGVSSNSFPQAGQIMSANWMLSQDSTLETLVKEIDLTISTFKVSQNNPLTAN